MRIYPNAKINIGLDILRRRLDGYHDIATIMCPIAWCDVLDIELSDMGVDVFENEGITVDCGAEDNLVMKALAALRCKVGDLPHVSFCLKKCIPFGAGLGGGSADAAFALTALNEFFSLNLPKGQLASIAATLGADCPIFIYNTPMLCTDTGTTLQSIEIPILKGMNIVVAKPPVSVPTREAYSGVTPHVPHTPLQQRVMTLPIEKWQDAIANDFETSVFPKYPLIERVKNLMLECGAVYAAMSGSGASVYGLFFDSSVATAAAQKVGEKISGVTIWQGNL